MPSKRKSSETPDSSEISSKRKARSDARKAKKVKQGLLPSYAGPPGDEGSISVDETKDTVPQELHVAKNSVPKVSEAKDVSMLSRETNSNTCAVVKLTESVSTSAAYEMPPHDKDPDLVKKVELLDEIFKELVQEKQIESYDAKITKEWFEKHPDLKGSKFKQLVPSVDGSMRDWETQFTKEWCCRWTIRERTFNQESVKGVCWEWNRKDPNFDKVVSHLKKKFFDVGEGVVFQAKEQKKLEKEEKKEEIEAEKAAEKAEKAAEKEEAKLAPKVLVVDENCSARNDNSHMPLYHPAYYAYCGSDFDGVMHLSVEYISKVSGVKGSAGSATIIDDVVVPAEFFGEKSSTIYKAHIENVKTISEKNGYSAKKVVDEAKKRVGWQEGWEESFKKVFELEGANQSRNCCILKTISPNKTGNKISSYTLTFVKNSHNSDFVAQNFKTIKLNLPYFKFLEQRTGVPCHYEASNPKKDNETEEDYRERILKKMRDIHGDLVNLHKDEKGVTQPQSKNVVGEVVRHEGTNTWSDSSKFTDEHREILKNILYPSDFATKWLQQMRPIINYLNEELEHNADFFNNTTEEKQSTWLRTKYSEFTEKLGEAIELDNQMRQVREKLPKRGLKWADDHLPRVLVISANNRKAIMKFLWNRIPVCAPYFDVYFGGNSDNEGRGAAKKMGVFHSILQRANEIEDPTKKKILPIFVDDSEIVVKMMAKDARTAKYGEKEVNIVFYQPKKEAFNENTVGGSFESTKDAIEKNTVGGSFLLRCGTDDTLKKLL